MKNQHNPKVSIITCTYNSEKYLAQCLNSIKIQDYQNIEHIIVDGNSTDQTTKIINNYRDANKKYKISIINSKPLGIANALNLGIRLSKGDIIHFVHSDDFYYSSKAISTAVSYFIKYPKINWILGNHLLSVYGKTIILPNTVLTNMFGKQILHVFPWMSHQNTFMKRCVYEKYGLFDESYKNNLDYDQWLRIIHLEPILFVKDNFSVFRVHRDSTTFNYQNFLRSFKEYCQIVRKYSN